MSTKNAAPSLIEQYINTVGSTHKTQTTVKPSNNGEGGGSAGRKQLSKFLTNASTTTAAAAAPPSAHPPSRPRHRRQSEVNFGDVTVPALGMPQNIQISGDEGNKKSYRFEVSPVLKESKSNESVN